MERMERLYRRVVVLTLALMLYGGIGAQAQVFNPANGHWYQRIDSTVTWTEARNLASLLEFQGRTGHLATVTSAEGNDFIVNNLGGFTALSGHWLGGFQDTSAPDYSEPAGGWRWVTGEAWSFTAWFEGGEPNNGFGTPENFLVYEHAAGRWNDLPDVSNFGYVVEFSAPTAPEPMSIGFLGLGLMTIGAVYRRKSR
ncbi:MAG: hypothetical protein OHK0029_41260 [Armatimonadaceae bacterium]